MIMNREKIMLLNKTQQQQQQQQQEEESTKSEASTKDLTVWSGSKHESMDASVAGSPSAQQVSLRNGGGTCSNSSDQTHREGVENESISPNNNNEGEGDDNDGNNGGIVQRRQETNHENASQSVSLEADESSTSLENFKVDCEELQQEEAEEKVKEVFLQEDDGVETIFEIQNSPGPMENIQRKHPVSQDPNGRREINGMKNTTDQTSHQKEETVMTTAVEATGIHSESPRQRHQSPKSTKFMDDDGSQQEISSTASVESSLSNGSCSTSTSSRAAKELILSVTKEEGEQPQEEEEKEEKMSSHKLVQDPTTRGKSQTSATAVGTAAAAAAAPTRNEITIESAKMDRNHVQDHNSSIQTDNNTFHAPPGSSPRTKLFLKSPLRISTSVGSSDNSKSNDAIKSPMRCESPGMRRRREELDRSHRSIRELEEQLQLAQLEQQQQQQHAEEQLKKTNSQQMTNSFFDAYEIQDCGQSLSSTTSSITSFGLLHNSSRTLLTSSNTTIHNDRCEKDVHCVANDEDQGSRSVDDATALRKAFCSQRDSNSLMPSDEGTDAFHKQQLTSPSWGTPKAANRSSPTMERDNEPVGHTEINALKDYYEEKLRRQRCTHEHQIDEIIEQLNNIESTYGIEISSLKKRLSQKEIMTEVLTNSLSEIKQQYEFATAKLEEARNEIQAGNDRYAALKHRMEREKSEAVETACNEIRAAAESQFASAQKTFIKLKQDYMASCDDRHALKRQCNELVGKVETLEAKARSYQNKISKLLAEGAEAKAKMATEKADALKMKQAYTEKVQVFAQKEKDMEIRIAKANRDREEAYALLQVAIKEKEAIKKENADLQSVCEELMTIVEETHSVTK